MASGLKVFESIYLISRISGIHYGSFGQLQHCYRKLLSRTHNGFGSKCTIYNILGLLSLVGHLYQLSCSGYSAVSLCRYGIIQTMSETHLVARSIIIQFLATLKPISRLTYTCYLSTVIVGDFCFYLYFLFGGQSLLVTFRSNQFRAIDNKSRYSLFIWFLTAGTVLGFLFLFAIGTGKNSQSVFNVGLIRTGFYIVAKMNCRTLIMNLYLYMIVVNIKCLNRINRLVNKECSLYGLHQLHLSAHQLIQNLNTFYRRLSIPLLGYLLFEMFTVVFNTLHTVFQQHSAAVNPGRIPYVDIAMVLLNRYIKYAFSTKLVTTYDRLYRTFQSRVRQLATSKPSVGTNRITISTVSTIKVQLFLLNRSRPLLIPRLFGFIPLQLANYWSDCLFMFNFAIVLYQTEY